MEVVLVLNSILCNKKDEMRSQVYHKWRPRLGFCWLIFLHAHFTLALLAVTSLRSTFAPPTALSKTMDTFIAVGATPTEVPTVIYLLFATRLGDSPSYFEMSICRILTMRSIKQAKQMQLDHQDPNPQIFAELLSAAIENMGYLKILDQRNRYHPTR